jgi:glycyl-tRNA synthetase
VRNGDQEHLDQVAYGNEQVLIARFSDAEFFYTSDNRHPLGHYLNRLSTLTFQEKLGSMKDKNDRVAQLVRPFGQMLNAADDLIELAARAAALAKADLGAQMVVEMTALQGTMGRIYALRDGEDPAVATAIFEHWLPRWAGDDLPASAAGVLLALLDRLDSLVGLFAVGLAPTGSADPFAMRRAALGVVQILSDRELSLNLRGAIALVAQAQPIAVSYEQNAGVLAFIAGRLKVWLLEQGEPHDVVEAVLAEQSHNPARALEGIQQLKQWVSRPDWSPILDAFARCVRILPEEVYELHPQALKEPAEKDLYAAYVKLSNHLSRDYNIGEFLQAFETIVPVVTRFFDTLLVMDENLAIRENRLALLQALTSLAQGRANLRHLIGF